MKTTAEQRAELRRLADKHSLLKWPELIDLLDDFDELEEENAQWKTWGIIEISVRNPNVASYIEHWEGRATKAEAENAKLKKALDQLLEVMHYKEEEA